MTRVLLYSHDTYGLGHFRRSALLAASLAAADSRNNVLIVTGSPRAEAFLLPDRVDVVKLPAATKNALGSYQPRKLGGGLERLVHLRSKLVRAAVEGFAPDVIVVDHSPVGMAGELRPMLRELERTATRPRLVLGLRDVIDEAERVDADWRRAGVWPDLDRYDDIFVYGDPRVLTTAVELDLASRVDATVLHTGYVAPTMPEPMPSEPFVLVTPGGGGDGQAMLRRYLDAVELGATAGIRSVVVTGPLLSASRQAELSVRSERLASVEMIEFSEHMRSLIASAAGVISMAGYNTVVEELAAGTPALLVPRREPRLEQEIRARRLAPHTALEHCPIEQLEAARVARFVSSCVASAPSHPTSLDLTGAATVASLLSPIRQGRREREPAYA